MASRCCTDMVRIVLHARSLGQPRRRRRRPGPGASGAATHAGRGARQGGSGSHARGPGPASWTRSSVLSPWVRQTWIQSSSKPVSPRPRGRSSGRGMRRHRRGGLLPTAAAPGPAGTEHDHQRSDGDPVPGRLATAYHPAAHPDSASCLRLTTRSCRAARSRKAAESRVCRRRGMPSRCRSRVAPRGPVHKPGWRASGPEGGPEARQPRRRGGRRRRAGGRSGPEGRPEVRQPSRGGTGSRALRRRRRGARRRGRPGPARARAARGTARCR